MKITEIEWTEGNRYQDNFGAIWEVYEGDLKGINAKQRNTYISIKYNLQDIANAEFEEIGGRES